MYCAQVGPAITLKRCARPLAAQWAQNGGYKKERQNWICIVLMRPSIRQLKPGTMNNDTSTAVASVTGKALTLKSGLDSTLGIEQAQHGYQVNVLSSASNSDKIDTKELEKERGDTRAFKTS